MEKLKVKARFEVTEETAWQLKGKQNVYFCAHPDDFARYFDEIADAILKLSDCAVWYDQEPELLDNMTLFVVPITTKLLTKQSKADDELRFAFENKRAVLPLMEEQGLEGELYERKFGKAHFLDKHKDDGTGKSYEDKFADYIQSKLVGDELAEKIRKAFDAYIFLSYRKKDRQHADELMRLIHKNDFCRDIAIWYDENLVPGEAFDKAIEAAMKKSHLFTVAVTPNLIVEENYVKSKEFKFAKEIGMPILPAELVETDRKKLSEQFVGIPDCVNPRERKELADGLMQTLPKEITARLLSLARTENDSDPEHNFLIGLAYLNAIDVEHDNDRALKLITSAAESGLAEAIEKLVDMYEHADGVEGNYETAIKWQRRLCEIYEKNWIEEKNRGGYRFSDMTLFVALQNLGRLNKNVGHLADAKSVYEKLNAFAKECYDLDSEKLSLENIAVSYIELGNICCLIHEYFAEAENHYMKAYDIFQKLATEEETEYISRMLASVFIHLGDFLATQWQLDKAEKYYIESLKINKQLADKSDFNGYFIALADSYRALGTIREKQYKYEEAHEYFVKSLDAIEQRMGDYNEPDLLRDYSVCLNRIAVLIYQEFQHLYYHTSKNDLLEKYAYYTQKAYEISEKLVLESNEISDRLNFSVGLMNMGWVYKEQKNYEKAEEFYQRSLRIKNQLSTEINTISLKESLADNYNFLGNLYLSDNPNKAREYFKISLGIREQLYNETHTVMAAIDFAEEYYNLGLTNDDAENYFIESLKILEQIEGEDIVKQKWLIQKICNKLANVFYERGEFKESEKYYIKSLETVSEFDEGTLLFDMEEGIALSHNGLGLMNSVHNWDEAEKHYRIALDIFKKLVYECDIESEKNNLALVYRNIGHIYDLKDQCEDATKCFGKCLALEEELVKNSNTDNMKYEIAKTLYMLANVDYNNLKSNLTYLTRAFKICNDLVKRNPDSEKYRKLFTYVKNCRDNYRYDCISCFFKKIGNIFKEKKG